MKDGVHSLLIVDDLVENIHLLREMLRDTYKIHFATNGQSALTLAATLVPDLILLDIIMPGMGGYEICSQLKANPQTKDIPVIFVTSLSEEANEIAGFQVGAVDYVTRPLRAETVKYRIKNHLALREANRKLEEHNASLRQAVQLHDQMERTTNQDMRVPISRIIETSELLLAKAALNHEEKELVHSIHGSSLQLLEMIHTSLSLHKIESGTYILHPSQVDILAVLGRILEEQESFWRSKHLIIHILDERGQNATFGNYMVMAEALLLHTLFGNLLLHAMENAPLGSTMTITNSKEDGFILLSILHTGKLAAQERDEFFNKCPTADAQDCDPGGYTSRLIAQLHGGEVTLQHLPSQGTLYQVKLPALALPEAPRPIPEGTAPLLDIPPQTILPEAAKILVVDDQMENIYLLQKALNSLGSIYFATSGEKALQVAIQQVPDLILLDVMMPGMDGYATLVHLRQERVTRDIPVVFVTAMDHKEGEEKGLKLGAIDYIAKPFHAQSVRLKVHNILELKKLRDFYARLSLLDGLTGIANRRRFDESLELEWRRGLRSGKPLSLLIMDVDFFKLYNDHYGHIAGDECLQKLAKAIASCVERPADLVARYGGEEFVCLLPETSETGMATMVQKIQAAVEELAIDHVRSPLDGRITLSLGGATAIPQADILAITLLSRADANLYLAKKGGRNQFVQ
ncbi:MAG: response regulator [Magnetococcales bacterium]|nr:response regulator [Magnetococcales bacterium]NGZ26324.1 response regulator [Magnetococcales bacterium]